MKQSELNLLRVEFRAAMDQFYSLLAVAREAKHIRERLRLLDLAIAARSRALAPVKAFLAEGNAPPLEAPILHFDSL